MSRYMWMLGAVLIVSGCEPKPTEQAPGKVTSEVVRRDVGKGPYTSGKTATQSQEDFPNRLLELSKVDSEGVFTQA